MKKSELLKGEQNIVGVENTIIFNKINRISGDLLYVADCLRLNDNGTADYKEVEKQWIAFSNRKTLYDQIRFIDVEGNEVYFDYPVDAREAVATGSFFDEKPVKEKEETIPEDLKIDIEE